MHATHGKLKLMRLYKRNQQFLKIAYKTCIIKIALAVITTTAFAQNERQYSPRSASEVARLVASTVVTVQTPLGFGSGVILDPSGVVVTNLHIIQGKTQVKLTLHNGDIYDSVAVVGLDERRDLVLLKIEAFNLKSAVFGNSDEIESGEDVVLVGTPKDNDLTVSEGVISALRDSDKGYRLIQTNAPASSSSCGGGMFNVYGELVGIITSQSHEGQNLNFAVPVNDFRGLVSSDATMSLVELNELVDHRKLNTIIENLKANENVTKVLTLEDSGDGKWIARHKSANNLDKAPVGIKLITDQFDKSIVWIYGLISGNEVALSETQLKEILELNLKLNFAKIGLSDDGDVFIMSEVELRTLDAQGLLKFIYAVTNAAGHVAGILSISRGNTTSPMVSHQSRDAAVDLLDGNFIMRYSSSEWKEPSVDASQYHVDMMFVHHSNEIYMAIEANRMQIPLEKIPDLFFEDIQVMFPTAKITRRGYRALNDVSFVFWEHTVNLNGVEFAYLSHAYSDSNGIVRIMGWTTPNLFEKHRSKIESFVDGLEVSQP